MKLCVHQYKGRKYMYDYTVIDQSLGLEFPIFQGGMAWVADASLGPYAFSTRAVWG